MEVVEVMLPDNIGTVFFIIVGVLIMLRIARVIADFIIQEVGRIDEDETKYAPLVINMDDFWNGFNKAIPVQPSRKQKTKEDEPELPDEFAKVINRVMDDPELREALIEQLQAREKIEKPKHDDGTRWALGDDGELVEVEDLR